MKDNACTTWRVGSTLALIVSLARVWFGHHTGWSLLCLWRKPELISRHSLGLYRLTLFLPVSFSLYPSHRICHYKHRQWVSLHQLPSLPLLPQRRNPYAPHHTPVAQPRGGGAGGPATLEANTMEDKLSLLPLRPQITPLHG